MTKFSDDFIRFLAANYPDDYRRVGHSDVSDDVFAAIEAKYASRYKVWRDIPEWLKSRYGDRIPSEVLNGNENVRDFVEKETETVKKEEKQTGELISFSVSMLALGYAAETVTVMAQNRAAREKLSEQIIRSGLTEELMAKWLETREKDRQVMVKDWQTGQPEKYMLHLFKELNRAKQRFGKAANESEKAAAGMKVSAIEREICNYAVKFNRPESREKLVNYLQSPVQQAALRHLSPEVFGQLREIMQKQGIKVEPAKKGKQALTQEQSLPRGSLVDHLKQNFERKVYAETIMTERAERENRVFNRVSMQDVLETSENDTLDKMMYMRRKGRNMQPA